jgi:Ser-tRNA(Ala) deacylase AlaX
MKKMSLSLLAAGAMAVAGMAHADAIFYPDGTSVELGDSGADSLVLASSDELSMSTPLVDTTVLGAGPITSSVATVTTVSPTVQYVYVQPNINWDRSVALSQLHSNAHLMNRHSSYTTRHQAAATFNVPARAGEASTMTGGAPNMVTDNNAMIVGSYSIPYSAVNGPYYVFSY